jgi:hypothetical protein
MGLITLAGASRRRHSRAGNAKTRKLLIRKRTRMHSLTRQVSTIYRRSEPGQANPDAAIRQLLAGIKSLQREAGQQGASTPAVAGALKDLETSLTKLLLARGAPIGPQRQAFYAQGLQALTAAHAKAKQAGHDWAL